MQSKTSHYISPFTSITVSAPTNVECDKIRRKGFKKLYLNAC